MPNCPDNAVKMAAYADKITAGGVTRVESVAGIFCVNQVQKVTTIIRQQNPI